MTSGAAVAPAVTYDLVLRGGMVVTSGATGVADIGIERGRVAQLGGEMEGRRELDVSGLHVLPGGVDVHVHLTSPAAGMSEGEGWVDDFESGSAAAIGGGITTIGNMTFQRVGESLHDALARDLALASKQALVDFVLHPVLIDPTAATLEEIPELAAAGHRSLKVFMTRPDFDRNLAAYTSAIAAAGRAGSLTLVHCEDANALRCACEALFAAGRGDLRYFAESRPIHAELLATERAIGLCRSTGSPIYVVHLSSQAALEACHRAQTEGLPVWVETRPLYLHLTEERFAEPEPGRYTGAPALRTAADRSRLWRGLVIGEIQTCGTDHAPWRLAQKLDPALDVQTARQGVADLETMLPMLLSEGVRGGSLSLSRFVEVTSTNAAKLFGLYPRKGTIAVGSDADLVAWDLSEERTIEGSRMHSRADYSPYDGWTVTGWPVYTLSRGEVVLDRGRLTADPGRGRWLSRERIGVL